MATSARTRAGGTAGRPRKKRTNPKQAEQSPDVKIHDRALRLLGVRWRSEHELADRLRRAGFEDELVIAEIARLKAVGLMDDQRFATEFARAKVEFQRKGRYAVRAGLLQKGVDRQVVDEVVEESSADEESRALALAQSRAKRLQKLEPPVAYQRLVGFLVRRGYPSGTSYRVARIALQVDDTDGRSASW